MKYIVTLIAVLPAGAAHAHFGHLGEMAGHGHWIEAAAAGAAIVIGGLVYGKGKKEAEEADTDAENDPEALEPQEA